METICAEHSSNVVYSSEAAIIMTIPALPAYNALSDEAPLNTGAGLEAAAPGVVDAPREAAVVVTE
jgi:hypothetical protein